MTKTKADTRGNGASGSPSPQEKLAEFSERHRELLEEYGVSLIASPGRVETTDSGMVVIHPPQITFVIRRPVQES